jgi:hypothetical protein
LIYGGLERQALELQILVRGARSPFGALINNARWPFIKELTRITRQRYGGATAPHKYLGRYMRIWKKNISFRAEKREIDDDVAR